MKSQYYPAFGEFKELSKRGNVIPVYRQLFADTLTPVSAFQKVSDTDYAFSWKVQMAVRRLRDIPL